MCVIGACASLFQVPLAPPRLLRGAITWDVRALVLFFLHRMRLLHEADPLFACDYACFLAVIFGVACITVSC
jgi:hypothetical protein